MLLWTKCNDGTGEYNAFYGALESGVTGGRKDKTMAEYYADYFKNFTMPEIPSTADFIQYIMLLTTVWVED